MHRADAYQIPSNLSMACAFAAEVFAEADIEHPVQLVFDTPVLADYAVQMRGSGPETGDVVADFALGFARDFVVPFRFDTHQSL